MSLSSEDQKRLLEIARQSITTYTVYNQLPSLPTNLSSTLLTKDGSGAFVTLSVNDRLRGCIGLMESNLPLADTVQRMAKAAAMDDPRFPKVRPDEVSELTIEISMLSPKHLISSIAEIELGQDGIMIEGYGHSGVFLPQVATETGWDVETFLCECCEHKAGLARFAWHKNEVAIYAFRAEIFSEKNK